MRRTFLPTVFLSLLCAATLVANSDAPAAAAPAKTGGARAATPDELVTLNDVLHKTAGDYRRWAYTEHRVMRDDKGRVKSDVLLRYDPSKPYPEQWTPLKINGAEPSERERSKYRRRGEKSASSGELAFTGRPASEDPQRRSLGELIEVMKSTVVSETAESLVFEVPLLKVGNERFPPEKFQVLARIRKQSPVLENIAVKLRESFRSKLVVKVKSGEGSLDFAQVDPKYPATLVAVDGDASASVLFVSIGGSMDLKRTELKHVKPFDERFDVQIGTLKAIDF